MVTTQDAIHAVLATVPDPEIPNLSIVDLGMVHRVTVAANGAPLVELLPTYSGCPATEAIAAATRRALAQAGYPDAVVRFVLSPAWSSDRITAEGRAKLEAAGIAPPACCDAASDTACATVASGRSHGTRSDTAKPVAPLTYHPAIPCPHCGSRNTERLSEFSSTACKALLRCRACGEPFEYFKPI